MKYTANIMCGLAAILLTGCVSAKGFPKRAESVKSILKALNGSYSTQQILNGYKEADVGEKKAYRNQVIAARMMAIDIRFSQFQKGMFGQRSFVKVGGDTIKSALSVAGTLTSAGQTSQILSGLTGAFDAGTTSMDSNIYQNQTQTAVMSMMRAERVTVRARIETRLQKSVVEYPLAVALSDLEDYYMAGSVPGALSTIATTAGVKQAEAETIIMKTYLNVGVEARQRMKGLREMVADLPDGAAYEIMKNPPTKLSKATIAEMKINKAKMTGENVSTLVRPADDEEKYTKAWLRDAVSILPRDEETILRWKIRFEDEKKKKKKK